MAPANGRAPFHLCECDSGESVDGFNEGKIEEARNRNRATELERV